MSTIKGPTTQLEWDKCNGLLTDEQIDRIDRGHMSEHDANLLREWLKGFMPSLIRLSNKVDIIRRDPEFQKSKQGLRY